MKSLLAACAILSAALASGALAQTPAISAVANNYSGIKPGLPNYGIAQGSIFAIYGSNLAGSSTGLQSPPLQTTLSGVSVSVTVGGVTKQALLYYVTPTQIGGIMPSSVPAGTGQITVTNNGATSAPAQIVVVQAAFGILTLNGGGTGPAAAFDAKYNYLGSSNAANPGDTILLWGTGLGPVTDDNQQSATNAPIEVDIGGVAANVVYHGRSQYPGLDQINVVVPSGSTGCYVSLVVRSGNYVSNFSSLPVASGSRACSDQTTGIFGGFSPSQLQALNGKTSFTVGILGLSKTSTSIPATVVNGITIVPASNFTFDYGFAAFDRVTLPQQVNTYVSQGSTNGVASIGSCTVYTVITNPTSGGTPTTPATPNPINAGTTTALNAGAAINVSGPDGKKSMPFQNGSYNAQLGGGTGPTAMPEFIPASGGSFTFDNGGGGPDIGAFTTQFTLVPVVWSNQSSLATVNRSQGATVTWTGGNANTYVNITGYSYTVSGSQYLFGYYSCTAPATAQQFNVPAAVLLALPPSGSQTIAGISVPLSGSMAVYSFNVATTLSIPGVDLAWGFAYSGSSASVKYQ
ncbi:MAG TPA: hypothetical protein VFA33_09110 [Bryobacteraceae bacterium]|nr:hypothetical protein [Bryobacteraceae bacterium]